MFRLMMGMAVVTACVGSAQGAAKKIKFFTATPVQVAESTAALGPGANPDGMAILNYAQGAGKTIVNIIASDMTPFLTYSIRLTNGVDEVVVLDALTTDDEGHGSFHEQYEDMNVSGYNVELFVAATSSGTLWSQLPDAGNLPSPPVNTSTDVTERAADNFEFAAAQEVSAIRWWGGWCGSGTPSIEEFRVRIYDSITPNGSTSNVIYEQIVTASGSSATGGTLPCGASESVFEADLPVAFMAAANTTYWIEIVGIFSEGGVFNMSNTSDGTDGSSLQWSFGFGIWLTDFPDRAFELLGASDSTELRSSGVNPG